MAPRTAFARPNPRSASRMLVLPYAPLAGLVAWRQPPSAGLLRTAPEGCRTGKYRGRRAGPEAVRCPIMGKLATVANRIVDRGELCSAR